MRGDERWAGPQRADFTRVLDQALRGEEILGAVRGRRPGGPTVEQLRARALNAMAAIAATAAPEYAQYAALRDAFPSVPAGEDGEDGEGGHDSPSGTGAGTGARGPGLFAPFAVLVPMLSGTAAVLFLVLGYGLRAAGDVGGAGTPLIDIGYAVAGVFGVALVVGGVGLMLTARRDAAEARAAQRVARARAAWRQALLVRGVLPCLRQQLAHGAPAAPFPTAAPGPPGEGEGQADVDGSGLVVRRPRLGFGSPGFTSPGGNGPAGGPA
ncbi:hypothetical protein [Streptomyces sp. NBC_00448]|uniref:hypothetical protein n=1 Tax=Streptomyces sp. NBC_00448 TaxID=2903652 RepID=UPI002E239CE4